VELEYARIQPVSRIAARRIVLRQLKPANFPLHGQVETAGMGDERYVLRGLHLCNSETAASRSIVATR
jgi:hypothetical protein